MSAASEIAPLITDAARDALTMLRQTEREWGRMGLEDLGFNLDLAVAMPLNSRSDYVRAAALAMHIAERMMPRG